MAVLAALLLALGVAWWSFPSRTTTPPRPEPLVAATPTPRRAVPVPVDPSEGLHRAVPDIAAEEPARPAPAAPRDTGRPPPPVELVMPVGQNCENLVENNQRLEELLREVPSAKGQERRAMLRQLAPLMQSTEVDGCDPVPDHRGEVTRILCEELRAEPDDDELQLITGFAEIDCD